jgi:hypothetical protein
MLLPCHRLEMRQDPIQQRGRYHHSRKREFCFTSFDPLQVLRKRLLRYVLRTT